MRFTAPLALAIAFAAPAPALDIVALGARATANPIVRFDSAAPHRIDGPTPVTNLGGYTRVALDRRPAAGDVVAVGVTGNSAQLFGIDLATAAATPIGTAAAGGRVAKLRAADCGTLAGDARDACRDELEGHQGDLEAFLAEDGAAGAAECEGDGLAQCLPGCG